MGEARTEFLLQAWHRGDAGAQDEVIRRLYPDMKRAAAQRLRRHRQGSMGPTLLAHEAYLKLADRPPAFADRSHFLAFASTTMKHLLIDKLRRNGAQKRGGDRVQVSFHDERHAEPSATERNELRRALQKLAQQDARQARVVELRFFDGLSVDACADALGLSPATVKREWAMARAWLRRELRAVDDVDA